MQYLLTNSLPSGPFSNQLGFEILAHGEPLVMEGPWPLGATQLACVRTEEERHFRALARASPALRAFSVAGLQQAGAGAAFAIGAHRIRDPERFQAYADRVGDVVAHFGGRFLARGGTVLPVAGDFVPERVVVIEFASAQRALEFYVSERYAPLLKLRHDTTDPRFIILARSGRFPDALRTAFGRAPAPS